MDASAYLRKQGWRGHGHSLDHTNRGIKKPLLVSKKVDVLGVGLNKHAALSDQWWLKAFDEGLKSLGTGEQTVLASVQKLGVRRGDLYSRFVKGEGFPGSIDQSLEGSGASSSSGTTTPAELRGDSTPNTVYSPSQDSAVSMAVDIPPADKLKRVVGHHDNPHEHDAMMYLLQNPDDAPASMRKMLDRKRKRAERPIEKRARRKIEHDQKAKQDSEKKRRRATEDGTLDFEEQEKKRRMKEINRRADEFVLEAQRRGIIPVGPNEIRKGLVPTPTGANGVVIPDQPTDEMQQVFEQAGLNSLINFKSSGKNSLKAQKYAREKMKRELKRAAKAYLMGEKPPHLQTREEKMAKKEKKRLETAQRKADAAKKEAEKMVSQEERVARKREVKLRKAAEKAEVNRIIAEREAAKKAGATLEEYSAEREAEATSSEAVSTDEAKKGNEFDGVADEVKFNMTRKGGLKKIPGVGTVDRYPTKAEKKARKIQAMAIREGVTEEEVKARLDAERQQRAAAEREKIDRYRAMKHGMDLEEYRAALEKGEVHLPKVERQNIALEKLAQYQKRAVEKGMDLEEYIKRRQRKFAETQSEKLGNPYQQDIIEAAQRGGEVITFASGDSSHAMEIDGDDDLGFVIDTFDANGIMNPLLTPQSIGQRVRTTLADRQPLGIIDTFGDEELSTQPNMPVPLDPRIWEGKTVKDLPKHIRKARKEWMAAKREARKAAAVENGSKQTPKQAKGIRKVAAREAFVTQVLSESRKALRAGGVGDGMVTIDGVANVPLVKVETREGPFKKAEMSLARTVARRVLRTVKREEKAKKGKGKGWKKRERSAKEAARNAGISGFTDRARMDAGGNRDLLL